MNSVTCVVLGTTGGPRLEDIASALERELFLEVRPTRSLPLPQESYDPARRQYSSEVLLRALLDVPHEPDGRLLGITNVDLFIPMMTFVFGQAQLGGTVAVVSSARLRQEFYGFPAEPALTEHRLLVESLHELGHTLGLTHCLNRACPMSLSTTLRALDLKDPSLCPMCRKMVQRIHHPHPI